MIEFFEPMIPPEITHQQKKVNVVYDKKKEKYVPVFYEPPELKNAREKFMAHFAKYTPDRKIKGPVRMIVKWCFPIKGSHEDGEYKDTKPDCGNSNKLLEDCLEDLGFYKNDAQIASSITEKFWAEIPGIYIRIEAL